MVIAMKMFPKAEYPAAAKIKKISVKEAIGWFLMIAGLVMLGNSLRLCFSRDIWYDELFTMGMIEHSYGELIHFTAKDVHPPLYYCIAKAIVDLCKLIAPSADAVILTKMVSVLPYFLLMIYALTFLRIRFGVFVAGIFSFCIVSMPQMSAYTVEMRMYSFALLFVTAAFFHAYGVLYDKGSDDLSANALHDARHYAALTVYGLAAAYTQYFACVAVVMVYLYLFICLLWRYHSMKRQGNLIRISHVLKGWLVCVIVSVIGYMPWLFVLLSQIRAVRTNYWILPLTWRSLGGCVKFLMKPAFAKEGINVALALILFFLYVGLLAIYGYRVYRGYKIGGAEEVSIGHGTGKEQEASAGHVVSAGREASAGSGVGAGRETCGRQEAYAAGRFGYALAGCAVLCGLVCFGFLASILLRPIFVYRYMLPAMGCFWLCFALCLDALPVMGPGGFPAFVCRIIFPMTVILVFVVGIRDYRAFMGEEEYKIVLMKETEKAIADITEDDVILYNFGQLQAVEGYYREQETYLWGGEPEELIVEMFGNKSVVESAGQIKDWLRQGRKVWFFGSFNSRDDIRKEWEADGIHTSEKGSYLLERYWFNIYNVYID